MQFTSEPLMWAEWVKTIRTPAELQLIEARARTVTKFTAKDRALMLRDFREKTRALNA